MINDDNEGLAQRDASEGEVVGHVSHGNAMKVESLPRRSWLKQKMRDYIGLTDDCESGQLVERLLASNIAKMTQQQQALARDFTILRENAADTDGRLTYYERYSATLGDLRRKMLRELKALAIDAAETAAKMRTDGELTEQAARTSQSLMNLAEEIAEGLEPNETIDADMTSDIRTATLEETEAMSNGIIPISRR